METLYNHVFPRRLTSCVRIAGGFAKSVSTDFYLTFTLLEKNKGRNFYGHEIKVKNVCCKLSLLLARWLVS